VTRVGLGAALLCAVAGCHAGGGSGGAAGGGEGGAGTAGAGGAVGAGGDGSGLPACAILARPPDPTNAGADGGLIEGSSGACNSILLGPPTIYRGCFEGRGGGGGAAGGVGAPPAAGTIRDGDYSLVSVLDSLSTGMCPPGYSSGTTRRALRVFGGGTYFEWAASNRSGTPSDADVWYDTTMRAAGHTLTFVSYDCGDNFGITSYGYTATADELTYFGYSNSADGAGDLQAVVRYRRICWR
jgi:hypothetical protein